ncbi:MAG: ubiquinone biosynthesis accessory factor UbiJ [Thalassotalea sp.]
MSFLMPQQVLTSALELIINQALTLNINDNHTLHDLNEKSLSVSLTEVGFPLCFIVADQKILVGSVDDKNYADCSLGTSLKTLWQLKQEQQITELIKQDKLTVEGDIKVAQQFVGLFEDIDIDWQSELAKHIGDIPTYQLSQLFGLVKQKVDFATSQIPADASEWLIHEKRLMVTDSELQIFHQAVNQTAENVNHLEAKVQQLNAKITELGLQK